MIILFKFLLLIFIAVLITGALIAFRIYRSFRNITDRFKGGNGSQTARPGYDQRNSNTKEHVVDHRNPHTAKPSREERGYTSARGPKGAQEWAKYFEGQVESQPFYEGMKKKKKK